MNLIVAKKSQEGVFTEINLGTHRIRFWETFKTGAELASWHALIGEKGEQSKLCLRKLTGGGGWNWS